MKNKQQTPLGYLMGLLDVSLADLGDYLYVAQTTISKWKTGARQLKPSSQHFAGIVEYFTMLARDPARRDKMVQLFSRLYPERPSDSPQALSQSIRAFLGGSLLPSVSVRQSLGEEGRLYTTQVGVYGGADGNAAAIGQLMAYLGEHPRSAIAMLNRMDAERIAQLTPALEGGHRVRLLIDTPSGAALLSELACVLSHPHAEIRLPTGPLPYPAHAAFTLVEQGLLLIEHALPGQTPYTALYTDTLTTQQYGADFDLLWQAAVPAFATVPAGELGPDTYRNAAANAVRDRLDWLLPRLPYLTMSQELLMEVLKANGVSGRIWTHVLSGYEVLHTWPMRLYVPAHALYAPTRSLPILSMLCGREIRLTTAQAKRHLLDTAALLRADRLLSLVPLQGVDAPWTQLSAFTRRNAFAGYVDLAASAVRLAASYGMVEAFMDGMDALEGLTTRELRCGAYVAGLLERVALEAESDT